MKNIKLLALLAVLLLSGCAKPNQPSESINSEESIQESLPSEESFESELESESESSEAESESEVESESNQESEKESEKESQSESESESEQIPPVVGGYGLENDPINTDPVAKNYYKNIDRRNT